MTFQDPSTNPVIELDIHKVTLYGYENGFHPSALESIIKGIRSGAVFDPVDVIKIDETEYELSYGGHHRSIAFYRENRPLRVCLVDESERNRWLLERPQDRIRVQDIRACPDPEYSERVFQEKVAEEIREYGKSRYLP